MREYRPLKVEKLGDGSFIFDFGVNLAGWARIRFEGLARGEVVAVRYDERHPSEGKGRHIDVHVRKIALPSLCSIVDPKTAGFQADRTLAEMAGIIGKIDDAAYFRCRAENLRNDFNRAFYKGNGVYENGFACGQAMALMFGLVPDGEVAAVRKRLADAVHEDGGKIDFGLLGSTVVSGVVSEVGETDLAWKMIKNETYPGFAHWIKSGATTF